MCSMVHRCGFVLAILEIKKKWFKHINANCSDEWVLDGVRVICSIVHRYGLKPYDALYMCLEENTSMSAIKLEALTWKVCADFGLCVLHVCDIDKHTYAWWMTSYVKLCNDGWHAWTTCVIFSMAGIQLVSTALPFHAVDKCWYCCLITTMKASQLCWWYCNDVLIDQCVFWAHRYSCAYNMCIIPVGAPLMHTHTMTDVTHIKPVSCFR